VARIGDGGDLLKCSFCGKSQKQVKKLIGGPWRVHLRRVHRSLQRDHRRGGWRSRPSSNGTACPSPREIYEFLDAYVIGQEKAKKGPVRGGVQTHYKRVQFGRGHPARRGRRRAGQVETSCCSAPTGSGKTPAGPDTGPAA